MSPPPVLRPSDPPLRCVRDGVETGIVVREGVPLCRACYRAYLANGIKTDELTPPAAKPPATPSFSTDLFGATR